MRWIKNHWLIPLLFALLIVILLLFNGLVSHAEEAEDYEYWVIGESNTLEKIEESDNNSDFNIVEKILAGEQNTNTETKDIPIGSSDEDIVIGDSIDDIPENEITLGESKDVTIGYSDSNNDVLNELKAIRQNSDTILYGLIPLILAFWAIYKFCIWFYETFIESAL